MSTLQEALGEKVRALRLQRGWTQTQLAERLGWHQPDVSDLEQGHHAAKLDTVEQIAKAFGVKAYKLLEH